MTDFEKGGGAATRDYYRKKRVQLSIYPRQHQRLKALAAACGCTQIELITAWLASALDRAERGDGSGALDRRPDTPWPERSAGSSHGRPLVSVKLPLELWQRLRMLAWTQSTSIRRALHAIVVRELEGDAESSASPGTSGIQ